MARTWLKRIRRLFAIVAATGVLAIGLLFLSLWIEHALPLELPRPTGPYAVGRVRTVWVDATREDPFAPSTAKRALCVWIWYPARPAEGAKPAPWLPESWERALNEQASALMTHFLWRDPTRVAGHSFEDAEVALDGAPYPVILFRSGIGALALDYSTLVEDLASHGYIVVGADAPYSTTVVVMPDGRVIRANQTGNPGDAPMAEAERERRLAALIEVWAADARFLLDEITGLNAKDPAGRFTGTIDPGRVGIAGHSFGGATAAQLCHDDARCRAGVDLDGAPYGSVVREGLEQPFLFLLADHGDEWTTPGCDVCSDILSIAAHAPRDKLVVTLLGAHHFTFSDFALTQSGIARRILVALGGMGGLDARQGLASTTLYLREFFDVHLRDAPRDALYAGPLVRGARFESR